MFLKNRNISSKIKRSKVTDYAALTERLLMGRKESNQPNSSRSADNRYLKSTVIMFIVFVLTRIWMGVILTHQKSLC